MDLSAIKPTIIGQPTEEEQPAFPKSVHARGEQLNLNGRRLVLLSSGLSCFAAFYVMVVAIAAGYSDSACSLYGLGFQCGAEALCSLLVAYRFGRRKFTKSMSRADLDEERESFIRDLLVDRNISVVIGMSFLISSAVFVTRGALKFQFWETTEGHDEMDADAQRMAELLSWPTSWLYLVVFVVRVFIARGLKSELMWRSAWSALASAIFAFVVAVLDIAQRKWQYSWRAEPVCAFVLAVCLFFEGMRTIILNVYDPDDEVRRLLD
jgi:Na+/melibiose symporter-like transporter